jgi:two-component system response regulator VicR
MRDHFIMDSPQDTTAKMSSKIMVVDDEPDTVGLVTLVLESEGHEVMPAYNGKDALDMLNDTKPDLILLDIMMPDIDGWDVYRSIRENSETKDIPVVMLTAKAQSIDKMIGLHVIGADGYITKPFGRRELVNGVKKHLKENSD